MDAEETASRESVENNGNLGVPPPATAEAFPAGGRDDFDIALQGEVKHLKIPNDIDQQGLYKAIIAPQYLVQAPQQDAVAQEDVIRVVTDPRGEIPRLLEARFQELERELGGREL